MIDVAKICVEHSDGTLTLTLKPDEIAFLLLLDYTGDVVSRATKDGLPLSAVLTALSTAAHSFTHHGGGEAIDV